MDRSTHISLFSWMARFSRRHHLHHFAQLHFLLGALFHSVTTHAHLQETIGFLLFREAIITVDDENAIFIFPYNLFSSL